MIRVNTALESVKFGGFLGEMLDFLSVRGHMIANFAHTMGFYGTSLDRYPHIEWRGKIYSGMNILLVGKTACGKGESLQIVSNLFSFHHRYQHLLAPVGRNYPTAGRQFVGKVYDMLHQYDEENRFLAIWEEYVTLITALYTPANKFNSYLIDLSEGNEINESFKTGEIRLSGLHYGSIGHITPRLAVMAIKDKFIYGGIANRHTVLYIPDSEYQCSRGQYDQEAFAKIQGQLIISLENGIDRFLVEMTPEAEDRFIAYDKDKFEHPSSSEKVVALMARFTRMCLQIAMIISIINGEEKISLASMESACSVMDYSRATLEYLFGEAVATPSQLIKDFIVTRRSVSRTEITQEFAHVLSHQQMDQALDDLIRDNSINLTESKRTRGRTANIYTPVV